MHCRAVPNSPCGPLGSVRSERLKRRFDKAYVDQGTKLNLADDQALTGIECKIERQALGVYSAVGVYACRRHRLVDVAVLDRRGARQNGNQLFSVGPLEAAIAQRAVVESDRAKVRAHEAVPILCATLRKIL